MYEKVLNVFYGADLLPYKDKECSVHFPIVGGAFLGASQTTQIKFYYENIGNDSTTWVSVAKLPNGKQGSRVLPKYSDENGKYALLELSNWYTQAKGDVFIALQGYQGGVQYYLNEQDIYEILGTPNIQTTGSIKLSINYAPIGEGADYSDEYSTYQEILALLGTKIDITSGIVVVSELTAILFALYENGQYLYDATTKNLYQIDGDSFVKINNKVEFVDLGEYSTYGELFGYTGNIPFVAYLNGKLSVIKFDNDDTGIKLTVSNSFGQFRSGYLLTNGAISENDLTLVDMITDNVIELSSSTGTLTAKQLEQAKLDNCVIKYSISYYLPVTENNYVNTKLFRTSYLSTYSDTITITVEQIEINTTTGAYTYSITGYSVLDKTSTLAKINTLQTNINASGHSLEMSIDSNYDLVIKLKDKNGNVISTQDVDLPLESIVTSATFYATYTYDGTTYTNVIVITLATTDVPTIIPVGDLVSGLVQQTDSSNKVYGTDNSGNQTTLTYSQSNASSTIAQRDSSGNISVASTPVNNNDATSKSYVDNGLGNKLDKVGLLPRIDVQPTDNVYDTIEQYSLSSKPVIIDIPLYGLVFFGLFRNTYMKNGYFYFKSVKGNDYYSATDISLDIPFSNIFGSTAYKSELETTKNKVTTLSSSSTDTQYPSAKAVWDNMQNVVAIAQGKTTTYTMYYDDSIANVKTLMQTFPFLKFYLYNTTLGDYEDKTSELINGDYDNYAIGNSLFNSENSGVADVQKYLIFRDNGNNIQSDIHMFLLDGTAKSPLHIGDIINVINTGVPDRWYGGGTSPYIFYADESLEQPSEQFDIEDTGIYVEV